MERDREKETKGEREIEKVRMRKNKIIIMDTIIRIQLSKVNFKRKT